MPPNTSAHPEHDLSRAAAGWGRLHANPPASLYHYTAAQGLLGILGGARLWATNARFMNDPSEIQYAARLVQAVLGEAAKRHDETLEKLEGGIFGRAMAKVRDREYAVPKIKEWAQNAISVFDDQGGAYIICFCRQPDLLSQWRGYGAVGGGYAVGFVSKQLGSPGTGIVLRKVIYDRQKQQEIVRRWVDGIFALDLHWRQEQKKMQEALKPETKTWSQFFEAVKSSPERKKQLAAAAKEGLARLNAGMDRFSQFLAECLVCFKDPAYREEQEWRLFHFGKSGQKILFRARSGCLVPYTELDVTLPDGMFAGKLPIHNIIYGPVLEAGMVERSLKMVLTANGYDHVVSRVARSSVPYRG